MTLYYAPPDRDGFVVTPGNALVVQRGGHADHTKVNGGEEIDEHGGMSKNSTINGGGLERVRLGGVSDGTTINDGGVEIVQADGGTSRNTTINIGGVENVHSNSYSTKINGGVENVESGGNSYDTTINTGVENVRRDSKSFNTTINAGGVEDVQQGPSQLQRRSMGEPKMCSARPTRRSMPAESKRWKTALFQTGP